MRERVCVCGVMSNRFIQIERNKTHEIPVKEWLAEGHLARFVVDMVNQLDLSRLEVAYKGGGFALYPPAIMLALLFYGYITGIFSSRQLERATYELIPVIYITGNHHPDHDTINTFRKRFLGEMKDLFIQMLLRAVASGVLQIGNVSLDGTKIHANASKNKAMSFGEEQLRKKVEDLIRKAEEVGHDEPIPGMKVSYEVALREKRLMQIGEIKEELEKQAQARYEAELDRRRVTRLTSLIRSHVSCR